MSRNGSGVYSPTAGVPVTSGTTISSTVFNNWATDVGNEITASLPVAGTAPMTGALRATLGSVSAPGYTFSGDTNTGIYSAGADTLNLATAGTLALTISSTQTTTWAGKAVGKAFDVDAVTTVASASTTDIGAAATSEVSITGTTTITGFGTSNAGIRRRGKFTGVLTLTHNATSLILPGGTSITTAAGDTFEAVSEGSGNWRVTSYFRASGLPIVNPSTRDPTAGTYTATTSGTTKDFTGIPSWATNVRIVLVGVSTNGSAGVGIQIGYSGGIETTGYSGTVFDDSTTANISGGFFDNTASAALVRHGAYYLTLADSATNTWVCTFTVGFSNIAGGRTGGGSKALSGTLDRVRLTASNGTDAFDAGAVNIVYW